MSLSTVMRLSITLEKTVIFQTDLRKEICQYTLHLVHLKYKDSKRSKLKFDVAMFV